MYAVCVCMQVLACKGEVKNVKANQQFRRTVRRIDGALTVYVT